MKTQKTKFILEFIHSDGYTAPSQSHNTRQEANNAAQESVLMKYDCWRVRIYEVQR